MCYIATKIVVLFEIATVVFGAMTVGVLAQESRDGREPTRSDRFRGRVVAEPAADEALSDEPKETIALTLWVVTVTDPVNPPADDLTVNLADQIDNLPTVVGSIKDARELVGRMKVAGMLRRAREYSVISLDGQLATAQNGRNQPRVIASTIDPRAGRTNAIQIEPLGTLVELRAQVDSKRNIQVSIKFNESESNKSADVLLAEPANGSPQYADVVSTRQFNTTASLTNDSAVVLQRIATYGTQETASGGQTELIILGASVLSASE
jgi:hypothetical protein